MKIKDITTALDHAVPLALQESYDNCGLLVGDPQGEAKAALITLDVTEEVLHEALQLGANLVIAHHPVIFKNLKKLTGDGLVERCVGFAIRHGLSIYAAHTNLDHWPQGVSHALGTQLGLRDMRILQPLEGQLHKLITFCPPAHAEKVRTALFQAGAGHIGRYDHCSFNTLGTGTYRAGEGTRPYLGSIGELHEEQEVRIETIFPEWRSTAVLSALHEAHPYEEVAFDIYALQNPHPGVGPGVIGSLEAPLTVPDFLALVKEVTGTPFLRYTTCEQQVVKKVALCGGAGSFLLGAARRAGAGAFLTADLKYHDFHDAHGNLLLVDAGHFETEQFAREVLKDILCQNFPNFAVLISNVNTNPVNYL